LLDGVCGFRDRGRHGRRPLLARCAVMALAAVYIAAVATTLFGLGWMLAAFVVGRVSEARWDRGLE
jgi:hypothetical protein